MTGAPELTAAERATVDRFEAATEPDEIRVERVIGEAQDAAIDMAFDWYCPSDRSRPRRECVVCVAEVAARAAIAAMEPTR